MSQTRASPRTVPVMIRSPRRSKAALQTAPRPGSNVRSARRDASMPAQTVARQSDAPPRMSSMSIHRSLPRASSAGAMHDSTNAMSRRG